MVIRNECACSAAHAPDRRYCFGARARFSLLVVIIITHVQLTTFNFYCSQQRKPQRHAIRTCSSNVQRVRQKYGPEEIVGYTVDVNGSMLYQVKWRNDENSIRLIESSVMRSYRSLMIFDFFESMILNNNQQN